MVRWGVSRMREARVHYFYFGDLELFETSRYLTFFALSLPYDYNNPIYLNSKLEKGEILAVKNIFEKRINERLPTPYITNEYWYGPCSPLTKFYINKDVHVPKSPIQSKLKDFMGDVKWENNRALDLGAGSGALGIILALINPDIQVDLVDICPKALKVAQINVDAYNLGKRVKLIESDLFDNVKNKYDFIVTVPPQISSEEYGDQEELAKKCKNEGYCAEFFHEPMVSEISDEDGLSHIKRIIKEAPNYLSVEGMLAVDIGDRLPDQIKTLYSNLDLEWFKFNNKDMMFTARLGCN